MRLVTFEVSSPIGPLVRLGALVDADRSVVDLNLAHAAFIGEFGGETRPRDAADFRVPAEMLRFLEGGPASMDAARLSLQHVEQVRRSGRAMAVPGGGTAVHERDSIRLLAPLPRPRSMREFSTYESHGTSELAVSHGKRLYGETFTTFKVPSWYDLPQCYKGNCNAVSGPDDDIYWPRYTERLDPEMELAFVIGREGRNIAPEDAHEHIAGFTMLIDVSARDIGENLTLGPSKGKDFCNIIGPCLVTSDEFDELHGPAWFGVDDEIVWAGDIGEPRSFLASHLVAYASDSETLVPGDLFSCGTIGMQCAVDTGRFPQPDQVCEFGIEGIGVIRSRINRPEPSGGWPRTRMPGLIPMPEPTAAD